MLEKLEVRNERGSVLELPIEGDMLYYPIVSIDGLDPVKANIVSSGFASIDGEQYQSSRREKRNVVINSLISDDSGEYTISQLRSELYRYFMPKTSVNLRFYSDEMATVEIGGRIEEFNAPLFSKEPDANISILCMDPDFRALTPTVISGTTVESLAEVEHLYAGSVDTGFLFELTVEEDVDSLTIYQKVSGGASKSLTFTYPLLEGDVLQISTTPGNKYATLLRGSTAIPVLYGIQPSSVWLTLQPGSNYIRVYCEDVELPWTISYTARYGGL